MIFSSFIRSFSKSIRGWADPGRTQAGPRLDSNRTGRTDSPESSDGLVEAVDSKFEVFIFAVPVDNIFRASFVGHWKTFYIYVQSAFKRFQINAVSFSQSKDVMTLTNEKLVFEDGPEWVPLVLKRPIFANATHCIKFRLKVFFIGQPIRLENFEVYLQSYLKRVIFIGKYAHSWIGLFRI